MKVKEKGHTIIIKRSDEAIADLVLKIEENFSTFQNHNLIIDVCDTELSDAEVSLFNGLNEKQKSNKKSFVVVFENADFNELGEDQMIIVPSLQEAHDIIEMEEIERDLGF